MADETLELQAGGAEQKSSGQVSLSMDLQSVLDELDDEDRALLILKYAEDYNYDELAEIFELSVSACKMRISRAREKLKQKYPDLKM